jgi:hypothetical protein
MPNDNGIKKLHRSTGRMIREDDTDFGFLGKLKSNTGPITVDFEIKLVENG